MPTHDEWTRFLREWAKLTPQQQTLFLAAVEEMIEDLRAHAPFRPSLREKRCEGVPWRLRDDLGARWTGHLSL